MQRCDWDDRLMTHDVMRSAVTSTCVVLTNFETQLKQADRHHGEPQHY